MITKRVAAALMTLILFSMSAAEQTAGKADSSSPFAHGTGPTDAIKAMSWLEGDWIVKMTYFSGGASLFSGDVESRIEAILGGGFLQERITVPAGSGPSNPMIGIRSFDRYRNMARVVWLDTVTTLADVYEGTVDGGGFVVSNVTSGTSGIFGGREVNMRITQKPGASRDAFMLVWEVSPDKGKTWAKTAEYAYTRKR